jgi:hypothetical protein
MFRLSARLLIGVESDVFCSVITDPKYLETRLATVGKLQEEGAFKPAPLTQDQLNRFTTSVASAENLFNKAQGLTPETTVDEKTGQVIGSAAPDPCRYGDWEVNGRCYDF